MAGSPEVLTRPPTITDLITVNKEVAGEMQNKSLDTGMQWGVRRPVFAA